MLAAAAPASASTRGPFSFAHVVDNRSHMDMAGRIAPSLTLETLPRRQEATVRLIEWPRLAEPEARRLRELGFDEGVEVEVLHRAGLGGGPIACRIGRMTVALRRAVAVAILVAPVSA